MAIKTYMHASVCCVVAAAVASAIAPASAQTDAPANATSSTGVSAPGSVSKNKAPGVRRARSRANTIGRVGEGTKGAAQEVLPRGAPAPAQAAPGPVGPLAPLGKRLEDAGVQIHLDFIDADYGSLGVGIQRVNENTGIFVAGVDFDLGRIANLQGSSLHFEEYIFNAFDRNHLNAGAGRFGDLDAAYQPIYNPTDNQLEILTFEQKFADGRADIEVGRSNFYRAFDTPVCADAPCFNYVLQIDARLLPSTIAEWSGRGLYHITPNLYVQGGVYEDDPQATQEHGFEFGAQRATGVIGVGEVGYKTTFADAKYPQRYELIGYYNTTRVDDPYRTINGTSQVFNPAAAPLTHNGNAGFTLTGQKTFYRFDGGETDNPTPTALVAVGSVAAPFTSGSAVSFDGLIGVTLLSPLQSRPLDTIGFTAHFVQLSQLEQNFLMDSNIAAGGAGYFKSRNEVTFELNTHIQVATLFSIDPKIEYFTNANNFFAPASTKVSSDGFYFGVGAVVPLGTLLGLSSLPF